MTIPWWHPVLGDEEAQAVVEVIASGFPNDGELTERFAARIADISGVAHGVGVSRAARRSTAHSSHAASGRAPR